MFGVGLCPGPSIMDLLPPHVEYVTGVIWATSVRDLTLGILGVEYEGGGGSFRVSSRAIPEALSAFFGVGWVSILQLRMIG